MALYKEKQAISAREAIVLTEMHLKYLARQTVNEAIQDEIISLILAALK